MDEREILSILQHYRHDIANELQVIQGYLSMGKAAEANKKMNQLFQHFQEERKLLQLGTPKVALWVTRFNSIYDHAHLTYNIHMENRNLNELDDLLLGRCKQIIEGLRDYPGNYYQIELSMKTKDSDSDKALVEMLITGGPDAIKQNKLEFDVNIQIRGTEEVTLRFIV